ncbi:prepilin peptidase [Pseudoduganella ginsengisoli]|nr:A24 family peptidase [Pseudoduganella ginsengisoli]
MELIFAGILGLVVGVVVCVVSVRLPQSMQVDTDNFAALVSGKEPPHAPFPVLPIESLAQLFPLSLRTVVACLLCALLSLMTIFFFGVTPRGLAVLCFTYILTTLFAVDIEAQLLPDSLTYPLMWLGLLVSVNGTFVSADSAIIGAILGYMALWALAASYKYVTNNDGMGNGDFKLMAALGAWHGYESLFAILIIAFAAAFVAWLLRFVRMSTERRQAFAFGPYMALAGLANFYIDANKAMNLI